MPAERRARRVRLHRMLPLLAIGLLGLVGAPPQAWAQPSEDAPAVAVLPLRVHSAKPLGYLGESVAGLIRSRLEASGEIRVLPATAVSERLAGGPRDTGSDAGLRRIAADLGAAYVVTGSLTELAGSFSLDVRVTPAAMALRSHTLVLTAQRDDELLERVDELADGVIERVVGAARVVVARVEFRGAEALQPELRARLATREGELYDPARLRDDLAMLRGHPGLASASVETERGPEGVVVRFRLVASERIFASPTRREAEERVAELRVRGNRRIDSGAIRARIATQAGGPFSPAQIAKDVKQVNALGFFRDIRVFSEPSPEGRIVTFEVEENPVVRQISISGNESVESDKIRDILTLTTGSTLDSPLLFENRGRIEALYRAEGYFLAEVAFEIEPLGEASVGIHFQVTENEKLRLKRIVFTGNEHFSDGELREEFQTKTWRFWSYATSWFDHSGTYSEPLFVQDLRTVEKRYTNAGFLRVEVGRPDVVPREGGLVVTVSIREGTRFRAGSIDVAGDTTVDIDVLREKLNLKEGEIFNRSHLTEDVTQLTEYYTDRGFYFANVTPLTKLSEEEATVDVLFEVRKGPLYFIRRVDVAGNTTTVDSVIRREIPIVEGQLYSQRAILMARDRVRRLGFFEEVELDMKPTDEPDQLDLEVSVVERPTGSFSFGAGYSSQDNFVFTGSLSQSNLFGRGYAMQLSADLGGRSQRFFLSFSDPRVFGTTFSLGTTIFRTTVRFEDFEQQQIGADLALGHALTEDNRSRGFLRYSFASREITESVDVNAAAVIYRELFQNSLTSSLVGLSYSADWRDDRLAPTDGYQLGASLEYSGLGFFSNFLRLEARGAWYLGAPRWLFDRSTFVLKTSMGYTLPLNDIGDYDLPAAAEVPRDGTVRPLGEIDTDLELPLSERYFLGGLGSFQLRGFRGRSVGPRRAILYQGASGLYLPVGRALFVKGADGTLKLFDGTFEEGDVLTATCVDSTGAIIGDGECNDISDRDKGDFADLGRTDVIGGNKFITSSFEYRFPISEAVGLQGVLFFDTGNAFAEGDNLFDVTEWRYGTGAGVQWFSPFGPLALVLGFPLNALSIEDSPVFEFSVGGAGF